MNKAKARFFIAALGIIGLLLTAFNNCSAKHGENSLASSGEARFGSCSVNSELQLFSKTYHGFLEQNCSSCHVVGGTGKGAFAASGLEVAWNAFKLVGYAKVSSFAVDSSHNSPYTGPHNEAKIEELKQEWTLGQRELADCEGKSDVDEFITDPWEKVRVHSKSLGLNAQGLDAITLRWDLSNDMRPAPDGVNWPSAPGAYFEVTVQITVQSTLTAYLISRPRIVYPSTVGSATDLNIKSIGFKINGEEVINETTFHLLDADARKNQNTLLSAGTLVAVREIKASDVISFSVGELNAVTLPPPPPGPRVSFASAATNLTTEAGTQNCPVDTDGNPLVTTGEKCVLVTIQIDQPLQQFSSVGFSIDTSGTTARVPCCSQIIDINDDTAEVNNFDRDFTIEQYQTFTVPFDPLETEKTIPIRIIEDHRFEPGGEVIRLQIEDFTVLGSTEGSIGNNATHDINIADNDSAPGAFEVTFTDLMKPNGAFDRFCIRCHHRTSSDVLGREYDMTTYHDLIDRGRVVPGNLNASTVWRRILGLDDLDPMPQGGLLNLDGGDAAREDIRNWILNGAKNN